jgi:hypothetical protein
MIAIPIAFWDDTRSESNHMEAAAVRAGRDALTMAAAADVV